MAQGKVVIAASPKVSELAKQTVERKMEHSALHAANVTMIPKLDETGFKIGRVLGRGGFCVVHEIHGIKLEGSELICTSSDDDDEESIGSKQERRRKRNSHRSAHAEKCCNYVMKRLHDKSKSDEKSFVSGIVDLATEAHFLSILRHPNIIALRATANKAPYDGDFFLILDKLDCTLTTELQNWKKHGGLHIKGWMGRGVTKKTKNLRMQQYQVAHDVADALKYMHKMNVIYRDVKSDNIGFTPKGIVKLFDFDLVKELNPALRDADGTYNLTGNTGSTIYMAPEVWLNQPYNESIDVYSFCILLWQILMLERPYEGFNMNMFRKYVIQGGVRPKCDQLWPNNLTDIMKRGWSTDWHNRPTMSDIEICLNHELVRSGDQ